MDTTLSAPPDEREFVTKRYFLTGISNPLKQFFEFSRRKC
jgi:hypothetical protein